MAPQSSCDDQNVDDGQDFQKLPFAVGLLINIALKGLAKCKFGLPSIFIAIQSFFIIHGIKS